MERIEEKVLENKVYDFFITQIPEMRNFLLKNIKTNCANYPINEYKSFNFDEVSGQGQDAIYLEMYDVLTNIAEYFIEQVKNNNINQIKLFINAIEPFIKNFKKEIIDQTTPLPIMFINNLFDLLDYYAKDNLQALQKLGLKKKSYYNSLIKENMEKYIKEKFKIVQQALNKLDPLGVAEDNVLDEYDDIAKYILSEIQKTKSMKELAQRVCKTFNDDYGMTTTTDYWETFLTELFKENSF